MKIYGGENITSEGERDMDPVKIMDCGVKGEVIWKSPTRWNPVSVKYLYQGNSVRQQHERKDYAQRTDF